MNNAFDGMSTLEVMRTLMPGYDDVEEVSGDAEAEAEAEAKSGNKPEPEDSQLLEHGAHRGYTVTVRLKYPKAVGLIDKVVNVVEAAGAHLGAIDPVRVENGFALRDVTIHANDTVHGDAVVEQLKHLDGVEVVAASDSTFLMHLKGKITIQPRHQINNRQDLSQAYTPGVARVCMAIHKTPSKAYSLTIKGNSVAVVTDGSRILSLGDIGPVAGLPVMEGKAVLFQKFGGVDAFPLPLATKDTEEIIRTIKAIAPAFGAINLEDIASPRCYEIEERLRKELDIPVLHDDQDATAIVVLAATLNAAKLTKKKLSKMKVVVCGVGAAGMACCEMLLAAGVKNLIGYNVKGAVYRGRTDLTPQEQWLAEHSNPRNFKGTIQQALKGADMFLGLSVEGAIKAEWLSKMKKNAICFALANPVPEVLPKDAKPYVVVMATGGSNYANQINNALVFPGFFRGALDARIPYFTDEMKMEAAKALAACITDEELDYDYIVPSVFEPRAHQAVAAAVRRVALQQGLARAACG